MKRSLEKVLIVLTILTIFSLNNVFSKVVRVGYMNQPAFIQKLDDGRFFGYGVEYLQEICGYTDWEIEYVFAPWLEQLRMLEDGELDVVAMVQYSEERAQRFLYTDQSIGVLQCLLFACKSNNEISFNDIQAIDGKRVGIQRGSRNIDLFEQYAMENGFEYQLVQYDFQIEIEEALERGDIDIIACEQMINTEDLKLVGRFGSDAYYLCTNINNKELMSKLNYAISMINSYNVAYTAKLYEKYFGSNVINTVPYFTKDEVKFINSHPTLTLALIPDSRPISYLDEDGNASGIVYDISQQISELSGIKFDYVFIPQDITPLDYLKENPNIVLGGVVLTNPAFENEPVILSNQIYETFAGLAVKTGRYESLDLNNGKYKIGIPSSFQALDYYIQANYPNMEIDTSYKNAYDGFVALVAGKIDLFTYEINLVLPLLGSPRFNNVNVIASRFTALPLCYCTATSLDNKVLISILNKCYEMISRDVLEEIERANLQTNIYHSTLLDNFYELRFFVYGILFLIVFVIFFLIWMSSKDKKNARSLAIEVDKAKKANRAKTEFLSRMSHDIRTPMNAITGMTALAQKANNNEIVDTYLKKIDSSSQLLLSLLNDILDSSAIESGKLKIANVTFYLKEHLQKLIDMYDQRCASKGIEFKVEVKNIDDRLLIGDPLRTSQILLNLLSNAYKFTGNGGSICFSIEQVEQTKDQVKCKFCVEDTGCGIDEQMMVRIFEPFEQKDATIAHKYGGSGLGLSIVKNLVDMLNGSIQVASTIGKGSCFTVFLPYKIASSEQVSNSKKPAKDYDFKGIKVLIADDDELNREVISGLLDNVNVKVDSVEDGLLALKAFESSKEDEYSLIFMDVHMPNLNGYEATKAIRKSAHPRAKIIPIIALSADSYSEDIQKAFDSGMNKHMSKPINYTLLYQTIDELLTK